MPESERVTVQTGEEFARVEVMGLEICVMRGEFDRALVVEIGTEHLPPDDEVGEQGEPRVRVWVNDDCVSQPSNQDEVDAVVNWMEERAIQVQPIIGQGYRIASEHMTPDSEPIGGTLFPTVCATFEFLKELMRQENHIEIENAENAAWGLPIP